MLAAMEPPAQPSTILAHSEHRPRPLPRGPWRMAQSWHDLLFAHWTTPADALRERIPSGLELDTHEGRAWIGVVPFRMSAVRLRGLPALPGARVFPELNVRTYVRRGDLRGVWFFSLDAASRLAVRIARAWFHLPYFDAEMESVERDGEVSYRSCRTHRGARPAELRQRFRPTGPVEHARPGSLEAFLTERYCLFASGRSGLLVGEIQHAPWPLQPAEVAVERDTMVEASGLEREGEPVLHYARRLDVLLWGPRKVGDGDR